MGSAYYQFFDPFFEVERLSIPQRGVLRFIANRFLVLQNQKQMFVSTGGVRPELSPVSNSERSLWGGGSERGRGTRKGVSRVGMSHLDVCKCCVSNSFVTTP